MRIILRAGGIIRSGPERDMIDEYMMRARHLAKGLGFLDITEQQVDLRTAKTRTGETRALLPDSPQTHYILLDERGKSLTSRNMARQLSEWRAENYPSLCFVIGGADGFDPDALPTPLTRWGFGSQTWPHKLVRVMAAEQIYRALSILADTPYHRD